MNRVSEFSKTVRYWAIGFLFLMQVLSAVCALGSENSAGELEEGRAIQKLAQEREPVVLEFYFQGDPGDGLDNDPGDGVLGDPGDGDDRIWGDFKLIFMVGPFYWIG